jgi:glucokinase
VTDRTVLALDVGGTKLAAAVVDETGAFRCVEQVPTPQSSTAEAVWDACSALLRRCAVQVVEVAGVGVGCGGPMRWPDGVVSPLNMPAWRDFPLRERVSGLFPGVPIRVHNDAIAVAVGEHWRGAGQGTRSFLGMVVSTGVGGGLVLDGRLVDGASGNAGHIGHIVVDADGPICGCGGQGCLEAIARGPAIAGWAVSQGWRSPGATARELALDAEQGDGVALAAFARAGRALGIALSSAIALCDVEVVAIGGGVSQAGPPLWEPLQETLRRHLRLSFAADSRVVPAALGQRAGLIGAAAFVLGDRYWAVGAG